MRTSGLPHALLLLAVTGTGVSGFQLDPKLTVQKYTELGIGTMGVCEVPNPSMADSLLIKMYLEGKKLGTTQTREGDREIAQTTLSPDQAGVYKVECTASNDQGSKTTSSSITVYNFPDPILEYEEEEDDEGEQQILITCKLHKASPRVVIKITATHTELTCEDKGSSESRCILPGHREHDGKTVACEAVMPLPGNVLTKNTMTVLDITYAPEFTDDGCPTNQTRSEGEVDVVLCKAVGNPTPEVSCSKGKITYPKGTLPQVTGNHSGQYACRARNKYDNAMKMITLSVQANPSKLRNSASSGTILSAMLVLVCHIF